MNVSTELEPFFEFTLHLHDGDVGDCEPDEGAQIAEGTHPIPPVQAIGQGYWIPFNWRVERH